MDLKKLPLHTIRITQQEKSASQECLKITAANLSKDKQWLEDRLRKLNDASREEGRDIQLLELAGNICHCFPNPHENLQKEIIEQRVEVALRNITVDTSDEAKAKLAELISTLQHRCPHNLVFGHYDIYERGEYDPPTILGIRVCAFCGFEDPQAGTRFNILSDRDPRIWVCANRGDLEACRKASERGDIVAIISRHKDFKAMMDLLEKLSAEK